MARRESYGRAGVPIAETRAATLLKRLTRFTCLVDVGGREERVFLPNSGRLGELLQPGRRVFLVPQGTPKRKTGYDLAIVSLGELLVSVDARIPNKLFAVALASPALPHFEGYSILRSEVPLGHGRLDFLLGRGDERCLVEVKLVTLVKNGRALFPDAPTERGTRHLCSLIAARGEGQGAAVVFIIQRSDAHSFSPYDTVDPRFGQVLRHAAQHGVGVYAFCCRVSRNGISLAGEVSILL